MKKAIITLLALTLTANAYAVPRQYNAPSYNAGYYSGKSHAYAQIGKTILLTGTVILAFVIGYQYGKSSRWTATDNGLTYRF